MKESFPVVYRTPELGTKVTEYSAKHSTPLPKHITDYHEHISSSRDDSDYMSSNFQSQLHTFIAKLIGAKRGKSPVSSETSRGTGEKNEH